MRNAECKKQNKELGNQRIEEMGDAVISRLRIIGRKVEIERGKAK